MSNLQEVAYKDLNKGNKTRTLGDMQRAAHSQGYDMGDPTPSQNQGDHYTFDLKHRKTGERVKAVGGARSFGGAVHGKLGRKYQPKGNTERNSVSAAMKADMAKRGRVNKTPKAKAKRAEEAKKNKEAKAKARDPFTRNKPTKTFEEFIYECAS